MLGTLVIIFSAILWAVIHSVLASHRVKGMLRNLAGSAAFDRMYRFSYNLFAASSLYPIIAIFLTLPDQPLYSISSPWVYLTIIPQAAGIIILVSAIMQTGLAEFIGWQQLFELGNPTLPTLRVDGWYAHMRHPLYTGSLLVLWFLPQMTVNLLAIVIIATLYFIIGAWFEERKLLKDFGPTYAEYKTHVPMFVPKIKNPKSKI